MGWWSWCKLLAADARAARLQKCRGLPNASELTHLAGTEPKGSMRKDPGQPRTAPHPLRGEHQQPKVGSPGIINPEKMGNFIYRLSAPLALMRGNGRGCYSTATAERRRA